MVKTIGNIQLDAKIRAVADAAITVGKPVIVNSDGTVSEVSDSAVPQDIGTPVTFQPYFQEEMAVVFDPDTGKMVLAYRDYNDSSKGKVTIGTISGDSVTFGTPVTFGTNGNTEDISAVYDTTNNKVVIAFRDGNNSNYGTAIVGTVSGDSISFGTAVVFRSGNTNFPTAAYDPVNDRTLIAFRDITNSTWGNAIAGQVSGTSISFGSNNFFDTNNVTYITNVYDPETGRFLISWTRPNSSDTGQAAVAYFDSSFNIQFGTIVQYESGAASGNKSVAIGNGKVITAYEDTDNNNYLTLVIGTMPDPTASPVAVTFGPNRKPGTGSEDRVNNFETISINYDSNADKLLLTYRDRNATNIWRYIVATSSDNFATDITFGEPTELISGVLPGRVISGGVDTIQNKILLPYTDATASTIGKAVVFINESGNLNSENFIGFADSSYADTQSASVDSTCSINNKQTGLTAGSKYYVQKDGTLSTTAGSPSVEAGIALSSTEILVKG